MSTSCGAGNEGGSGGNEGAGGGNEGAGSGNEGGGEAIPPMEVQNLMDGNTDPNEAVDRQNSQDPDCEAKSKQKKKKKFKDITKFIFCGADTSMNPASNSGADPHLDHDGSTPYNAPAQDADFSYFSKGNYGYGSWPNSSETVTSVPVNTNLEEAHNEAGISSLGQRETRTGASVGEYDASSASRSEELRPGNSEMAQGDQTSSQMQLLPDEIRQHSYTNSPASSVFAANVDHSRESDFQHSLFPVTQSMSTEYWTSTSSEPAPQILPRTSHAMGPLHPYSQPNLHFGPHSPRASFTDGPSFSRLLQLLAEAAFPQYINSSLPQPASGYGGLASTTTFPGNYQMNPPPAAQSGTSLSYDNISSSQWPLQHYENPAMWPHVQNSPTMLAGSSSSIYNYLGQTQQPGGFRQQGQQQQPNYRPDGDPNIYPRSQTGTSLDQQHQQNPRNPLGRGGSQGPSTTFPVNYQMNPAMWPHGQNSPTMPAGPSSSNHNYQGQTQQPGGIRLQGQQQQPNDGSSTNYQGQTQQAVGFRQQGQQQQPNYRPDGDPNIYPRSQTGTSLDQQHQQNPRNPRGHGGSQGPSTTFPVNYQMNPAMWPHGQNSPTMPAGPSSSNHNYQGQTQQPGGIRLQGQQQQPNDGSSTNYQGQTQQAVGFRQQGQQQQPNYRPDGDPNIYPHSQTGTSLDQQHQQNPRNPRGHGGSQGPSTTFPVNYQMNPAMWPHGQNSPTMPAGPSSSNHNYQGQTQQPGGIRLQGQTQQPGGIRLQGQQQQPNDGSSTNYQGQYQQPGGIRQQGQQQQPNYGPDGYPNIDPPSQTGTSLDQQHQQNPRNPHGRGGSQGPSKQSHEAND